MEKEKINVAEILKDCQAGMNLGCVCFENVVFDRVDDKNRIRCFVGSQRDEVSFNEYGCLNGSPSAKCVIFPVGEISWEVFQKPKFKVGDWVVNIDEKVNQVVAIDDICGGFTLDDGSLCNNAWNKLYRLWTIQDAKEGDVLSNGEMIVIFKHFKEPSYRQHIIAYIGLDISGNIQITDGTWKLGIDKTKPATKKQRDLLFRKMKDAGYTFDFEKKELKKLIPNKFDITTLKPFDKVLVRDTNEQMWVADFFSHKVEKQLGVYTFVCVGHYPDQCIPYEGNEHLLGKTDDCADYFKTWSE